MYQAYYRKYRPQTFDTVYGQRHITETLKSQVQSGRVSHAYLFTGTRGTGKTTCAKILARAVNCEHPINGNPCNECPSCRGIMDGSILDVLELDAASNTGVDNIRSILEEITYPPANVRRRVYIIDEVHMLSAGAFNALLKTLEEPPEYVMFILATTELHRVAATILSRCQRFDFKRVDPMEIAANISAISEKENFRITPKALDLLSRLADGSVRDSLSLLERCMIGREGDSLDEDAVIDAMGIPSNESMLQIVGAIADQNVSSALLALDRIYMDGRDIRSSLERLAAYFRDVLLYQTAPDAAPKLTSPGFDHESLQKDAERFSPQHVMNITAVLQKTIDEIQRGSGGRLEAELCLIGLCAPQTVGSDITALAGRLAALETKIASGTWTQASGTDNSAAGSMKQPKNVPGPETASSVRFSVADDCPFPVDDAPPIGDTDAPPPAAPRERSVPGANPRSASKGSNGVRPEIPAESKKALIQSLSGKLPRSVHTQLMLMSMYYQDHTLLLVRDSEMAMEMLDKANVRSVIADAAAAVFGESCTVRVAPTIDAAENRRSMFDGFDKIVSDGRSAGIQINLK